MSGILTYSGRLVRLDVDAGVDITPPSIEDIGLALSRVPRFAGHTRRWWTVAHHVLWLEDYAKHNGATDDIRLGVLLHDAHEAVFGDIPSPFKTVDTRSDQRELDRAIFHRYHPCFWQIEEAVKHYDRIGLLTEADAVGPPALNYSAAPDVASRRQARALFEQHFPAVPEWRGDAYRFLYRWLSSDRNAADEVGLRDDFINRVVRFL